MCSEGVARAFRGSYPGISLLSTLACLFAVSSTEPLHVEVFTTTPMPINGTIQVERCGEGALKEVCEMVVDQPGRLGVDVYHVSMGMPFLACCFLGSAFCIVTRKEASSLFSMDSLFVTETFGGRDDSGQPFLSWELLFWGYVMGLHWALVPTLTSPVDIFDTVVIVALGVVAMAFLCRPRGPGSADASGVQAVVLSTLLLCTWLAFTSIPHAYQADRLWLFALLFLLDGLLLLVHMYDSMPTMYTISMGRITFVALANTTLAYSFISLEVAPLDDLLQ